MRRLSKEKKRSVVTLWVLLSLAGLSRLAIERIDDRGLMNGRLPIFFGFGVLLKRQKLEYESHL